MDKQETSPYIIARWILALHRYFIRTPLRNKEMLPPGSAPIYTHSLEYMEKYKQYKTK